MKKGFTLGLIGALLLGTIGLSPDRSDAAQTNVLSGIAYTASVAADSGYPDSGGTELTDDAYAAPYLADAAWQGRFDQTSYSFTANLGSAQSIQDFKANFYKYTGAAVQTPTSVQFQYSTDNVAYSTACSLTQQGAGVDIAAVPYACSAASPVNAQYVRLVVGSAASAWSFLDEWEVLSAEAEDTLKLSGTFLQPDLGDVWTNSQWTSEFDDMEDAGMDHLILQWSANSKHNTAVYPSTLSGYAQNTTRDVVGKSLEMGDAYGMDIYMGLQLNEDWFVNYTNDTSWLNDEEDLAIELAEDLWDQYGDHDSFAGWYLSFEVDNWNLPTSTEWQRIADFYDGVATALHTLTPGLPIMISPFYNVSGGLSTSGWQTMWEYILSRADIDIFALQDGVGAAHAVTADLDDWFAATRAAIDNASPSTELWSDVETFNMDAKPMDIKMLVADMNAVAPYADAYTSFSFNHYMSPGQVNPLYYATYLDYLANGAVESVAPSAPSSLTATASGSMTVNLSWTASTDAIGVAGYRIYRNNELVYTSYTSATSFSDEQLAPSTTYAYKVMAFDAAGNESAFSSAVSATTGGGTTYSNILSSGKSYVSTLAPSSTYPDTGSAELTNGAFGTTSYSDAAWSGFNTGSPFSFTIDLGSSQTIREVTADFLQVKSVYIFLPSSVTFAVSNDNLSFTTAGSVSKPAVSSSDQTKTYRLTGLSGIAGRYVKVTVAPLSSAWTFVDELQVKN